MAADLAFRSFIAQSNRITGSCSWIALKPERRLPSCCRVSREKRSLRHGPSMSEPMAGPSVLVIDDEAGILETMQILLRSEGFTPHIALGGKRGLEQIAELKPEIVLSDVRMPDVNGL